MQKENNSVLIIDDEALFNNSLTAILEAKGFYVKNADLGRKGLMLFEEGFDLILLDIKLPDMEGIEVLKAVKSKKPDTIVIVVTGYISPDMVESILSNGAYAYLVKPFDIDELLAVINSALKDLQKSIRDKKLLDNLSLLYRISKEMEGLIELHSISLLAARYLSEATRCSACAVFLLDSDSGEFVFGALNGVEYDERKIMSKKFMLDEKMRQRLIKEKNAVLIPELKTKPDILNYIPVENPKSVFIFPLAVQNKIVGIALFIHTQTMKLLDEELERISVISKEVAVYVENAVRYFKLKQGYLNSVMKLVGAIEKKEGYLQGHAKAVAEAAVNVARKMGLSEADIEIIGQAALLHDIGKIAVSEQILLKKEKLTADEYAQLKKHSAEAVDIIADIDLEHKLLPLILYHHERYDGSGYPKGLRAEYIPIGARILAVCDAFKAMVSDRPYRKKLSREEALKELTRCAGTQFDPEVVKIFVENVF
ncbi:MAG: response regulator [Candidatus Omnitrophica bacterium]|nr:response regulator [Candidatus Omnitrophota bacterium]